MRRLSAVAILAVLPALCGLPAAAQEAECADPMTQMEMNQCAFLDWERADQHLNAVYKQAIALARRWDTDLPEGGHGAEATLRDAQRAWIAYRDLACEAEGFAMKGGSGEPLLVYSCKARLTEQRSADLLTMVDSFADL